MTNFLTVEDVIAIHDKIEPRHPVIDRGKLEGGVMRAQASYDGKFLFETVYQQASVLLHGVVAAHGFQEGNKRTAWVSALTFLAINGVETRQVPASTAADYVESVANRRFSEQDTALWFAALDPSNARPLGT